MSASKDAKASNFPSSASVQDTIDSGNAQPDADEFLIKEWNPASPTASASATSVYVHAHAKGQRYHAYKHAKYPLPADDPENNWEGVKHAMMLEITDGKLFYAPIREKPNKIFDVGTGTTGIWSLDAARLYPDAEVIGVDISAFRLSPIQPPSAPPNIKFSIDDIENGWPSSTAGSDFAHFRGAALLLRDLQKAVDQTFRHLKPGGWVELQETYGMPYCDDGTMPADDSVKHFYELCIQAMGQLGVHLDLGTRLGAFLERAGFTNVTCVRKKFPLGTWPKDATMRLVGLYAKEAANRSVELFERSSDTTDLPQAEIDALAAKVRAALDDNAVHRYCYYYFWYAQKPAE